jgi:hypothetical protein
VYILSLYNEKQGDEAERLGHSKDKPELTSFVRFGRLKFEPRHRGNMAEKSAFVLKEFLAQKDKSTNDAVVTLRPGMYAHAKGDDKEAKLKEDTIGTHDHTPKLTKGLVQYDDFKRLKAEIEHNRKRNISPAISEPRCLIL